MKDRTKRIVEVDCITHVYPDMTKVQICGLDFIVNQGERVSHPGLERLRKDDSAQTPRGSSCAKGWKREGFWGGSRKGILKDQGKDRRCHAGCG